MKLIIDNKVENVEIECPGDFEVYMRSDLSVDLKFSSMALSAVDLANIMQIFSGCDCSFVVCVETNRRSGFLVDGIEFTQKLISINGTYEVHMRGENFRWI